LQLLQRQARAYATMQTEQASEIETKVQGPVQLVPGPPLRMARPNRPETAHPAKRLSHQEAARQRSQALGAEAQQKLKLIEAENLRLSVELKRFRDELASAQDEKTRLVRQATDLEAGLWNDLSEARTGGHRDSGGVPQLEEVGRRIAWHRDFGATVDYPQLPSGIGRAGKRARCPRSVLLLSLCGHGRRIGTPGSGAQPLQE
jgi:hypothetical protein